MTDINSVTEGRVTVTANDTEENIREAAGFAAPEAETSPESKPTETPDAKAARERDEAGKFKAKAETPDEPAKPDLGGDPRKSIQAKINAAVAKQREAERRADELERRMAERDAEYQARSQPAPVPVPSQPAVTHTSKYLADVQRYQAEADAPKFDDFVNAGLDDPYTVHQAAMAAYISDRRMAERETQQAQRAAQQASMTHAASAMSIALEAHPELSELVRADTRVYPDPIMDLLKDEAARDPYLSAELYHHLLTHPSDADQLAAMSPIAAAREIGRLTAGLSSALPGPETTPLHTNAKPLIKPVRPSVMAHESSPPDDLPFGPRYIAAMNEAERKAREARRA